MMVEFASGSIIKQKDETLNKEIETFKSEFIYLYLGIALLIKLRLTHSTYIYKNVEVELILFYKMNYIVW